MKMWGLFSKIIMNFKTATAGQGPLEPGAWGSYTGGLAMSWPCPGLQRHRETETDGKKKRDRERQRQRLRQTETERQTEMEREGEQGTQCFFFPKLW